MSTSRHAASALGVLLLLLCGCAEDLPKATEIERMRLLGATLSVKGDPTRTTPAPKETVHVALSTEFPKLSDDRSAVQSLVITCTAPDRYTGGIPICQELIDAASTAGSGGGASDIMLPPGFDQRFPCDTTLNGLPSLGALSLQCARGEQAFDFTIPEGYAADELLFLGIVCEHGTAVLDPALPGFFGCEDEDAVAIPVHGLITVQHDAQDENHNPDIDALHLVRQEDGPWEPVDPALITEETEKTCFDVVKAKPDDPSLPWVIGPLPIQIGYEAAARELDADGKPEALELTVYATDGDLERRFTLFDSDEEGRTLLDAKTGNEVVDDQGDLVRELHADLRWDSPEVPDLPDHGELIRFFVTLRDGRGGFAQADYALCAINRKPN